MQWRGVRRLSVRPSVNFCENRLFSHTNGRIATKLSKDELQVSVHPGCAQCQCQGHVIGALSWILGMSYFVIDGLVCDFLKAGPKISVKSYCTLYTHVG